MFYNRRILLIPVPTHGHTYGPAKIPANIGRRVKRTLVNAGTYTVLPSDEYVVASENCTLTLPAASDVPEGWMLMVANPEPASLTIGILVGAPTDTIGGIMGTLSVGTTLGMTMLVSDGVDNWETVTPASPILL